MRTILVILVAFLPVQTARAQIVEVVKPSFMLRAEEDQTPVEWLGRGFVDYGFSGQLSTTAQVVKLRLGEPDGFSFPFYLLVGATNSNLGDPKPNKSAGLELVSPTGGLANFYVSYSGQIMKWKKVTRLAFAGSVSGRIIAGRDTTTGESLKEGSYYADAGLRFQTGLYDPKEKNPTVGVAWVQGQVFVAGVAHDEEYFGANISNVQGARGNIGMFLAKRVDIKIDVIWMSKDHSIPGQDATQVRLGFDYSVTTGKQ
jgi:hypothetical protein